MLPSRQLLRHHDEAFHRGEASCADTAPTSRRARSARGKGGIGIAIGEAALAELVGARARMDERRARRERGRAHRPRRQAARTRPRRDRPRPRRHSGSPPAPAPPARRHSARARPRATIAECAFHRDEKRVGKLLHLRAGDDGMDARARQRALKLDAADERVRVRRADDCAWSVRAADRQIVDEPPAPLSSARSSTRRTGLPTSTWSASFMRASVMARCREGEGLLRCARNDSMGAWMT